MFKMMIKHKILIIKYLKNKFNSVRTLNNYFYLLSKRFEVNQFDSLDEYYKKNKIYIYEGYSTQSIQQKQKLIEYSKDANNILEIGFNAGHSAELFLSSSPTSKVTSVDIGYWYYCKFGATYLNIKSPERI